MNRNRNRNDYSDYRNESRNYGNQGNWGGGQNAFQRNESAWNRGNVDSPGGWGQSYGANRGTGAPGSGYEGRDYQRENLSRRDYPYSDYNRREERMPYERGGRNFFERAGDTIRRGWDRAGEAIREGWDDITDRDDSDYYYGNRGMRNRSYDDDYGYNDRREHEFRRGSEYGGMYGSNYGREGQDYGRDAYGRSRNEDYYTGGQYGERSRNRFTNMRDEDYYGREDRNLYNDFNRSWDR